MTFQRILTVNGCGYDPWAEWIYAGRGIFVSAIPIDIDHVGLLYSLITTA